MYKLLTEDQKKKVAHEYALRRAVIMVWAAIAVIIIGMAGLFPSYVLSGARQSEVAERLQIMGNLNQTEEEVALQTWVRGFNTKLKTLSPATDVERPSVLIEKVLKTKTGGVKLTSIEWKKEENKPVVYINGIARDRQALISFEHSLNTSSHFGEVALPISNLAKEKDISFQVKLSLAPSQ